MGEMALSVPILPGKTAAFEELCRKLQGDKSVDVADMLRRHGSRKETWFLESGPQGDAAIVYWEADDPGGPMKEFATSRHPFDMWLKAELLKVTGVDLNNPPPMQAPKQVFRSGY